MLTGLRDIDRVTNGFHEGDLVILAARPGIGKTSLAMNIVEHAAVKEGYTCAVFSLEMPKTQIAQRMLCSLGRVSMSAALHGELKPKDWNDLWKASDIISQSKIFVDDSSLTTPAEILSKCRRLKSRYGLDLVMIDYIQLMSSGKKSDNRQQEVSDITRNLKIIAKELGVPILALSQLSRGIESRKGAEKKPQLSDLRESGAIEQDADIVMFISKQTPAEEDPSDTQDVLLSIAKHRNGELADINLKWMGSIVRFVDSDDTHLKNALAKTYQQNKENKEAEIKRKQQPEPNFAEETMPSSLEDLEKLMSDVPLPPPPTEEIE